MKKLSKELIGATSTPIILSILSEQESYGYEIIQSVKKYPMVKLHMQMVPYTLYCINWKKRTDRVFLEGS